MEGGLAKCLPFSLEKVCLLEVPLPSLEGGGAEWEVAPGGGRKRTERGRRRRRRSFLFTSLFPLFLLVQFLEEVEEEVEVDGKALPK